jgi:hypothetical protein
MFPGSDATTISRRYSKLQHSQGSRSPVRSPS